MNSIRGLLVSAAVLVLFCAMVHSQLTFSPYWGKRSSGEIMGLFAPQNGDCKNANDFLKDIFRFMQMKAQAYMECSHGQ